MLLLEAVLLPGISRKAAFLQKVVQPVIVSSIAKTFYYRAADYPNASPRIMERNSNQDARRRIDDCADRIYALAKLLELADQLDSLNPKIDPQAVAQAGKMIAKEICILTSILDDLSDRAKFRR